MVCHSELFTRKNINEIKANGSHQKTEWTFYLTSPTRVKESEMNYSLSRHYYLSVISKWLSTLLGALNIVVSFKPQDNS